MNKKQKKELDKIISEAQPAFEKDFLKYVASVAFEMHQSHGMPVDYFMAIFNNKNDILAKGLYKKFLHNYLKQVKDKFHTLKTP